MSAEVVLYLDSAGHGGMEETVLTVLGHLDRTRFRPVLAHHGHPALAPLLAGARALDVPAWAVPPMRGARGARPAARLAAALRARRTDVVHAHLNWPLACQWGLAAAAGARRPAVCATDHSFVPIPWRRARVLRRALGRLVDRHVAVSRAAAERLVAEYGVPRDRVAVVADGIDVERFARADGAALRRELGAAGHGLLLAAGRLDEQKGHRHLLDALARLPGAMLLLAGDGPARASLEAHASALGLGGRVRFLGQRDDVPALVAACDVVVQPSAGFEAFGLLAAEGMAAGKPVVVTDVGGPAEVVAHGRSGLVVPPGDAAALAGAVGSLLADPGLRERLGAAGRVRVAERFTAAEMAARLMAVYDDLLAAGGRHA